MNREQRKRLEGVFNYFINFKTVEADDFPKTT